MPPLPINWREEFEKEIDTRYWLQEEITLVEIFIGRMVKYYYEEGEKIARESMREEILAVIRENGLLVTDMAIKKDDGKLWVEIPEIKKEEEIMILNGKFIKEIESLRT